MDEVNRLSNLKDEHINEAKKLLAFEITKLIHGENAALEAQTTAESLFGNKANVENMPSAKIPKDLFVNDEISITDICVITNITKSKGEAKTLITQGGISLNDEKITDPFTKIHINKFDDTLILKKGKKVFIKLEI